MAGEGPSDVTSGEPGRRGKNILGRVNSKSKCMEEGRCVQCVTGRKERKVGTER